MHNDNAPDNSGASVDAQQTEKALSEIKKLGQSPDDNYRTWYEIFVYSFFDYHKFNSSFSYGSTYSDNGNM